MILQMLRGTRSQQRPLVDFNKMKREVNNAIRLVLLSIVAPGNPILYSPPANEDYGSMIMLPMDNRFRILVRWRNHQLKEHAHFRLLSDIPTHQYGALESMLIKLNVAFWRRDVEDTQYATTAIYALVSQHLDNVELSLSNQLQTRSVEQDLAWLETLKDTTEDLKKYCPDASSQSVD